MGRKGWVHLGKCGFLMPKVQELKSTVKYGEMLHVLFP